VCDRPHGENDRDGEERRAPSRRAGEARGVLKGPDTDVNLHVFSAGAREVERMLLFRDRLRAVDEDRERYVAAKRALAERRWEHVQQYADAKTPVVEEIIARARRDAAGRA
jgi:GrpB-like predicted nucleotidyltransferase (UPF0157 family)